MISAEQSIPNQPKPKGGRRPGAGRKPSTVKGVLRKLPKLSAELILKEINAHSRLAELANSEDESVSLQAIKFLWEQAFGKPRQPVTGPGGEALRIVVEHIGRTGSQNQASA